MKPKDANEQISDLVQAITGTKKPHGEDLLGSPELRRQLREAKKKLKDTKGKKSV